MLPTDEINITPIICVYNANFAKSPKLYILDRTIFKKNKTKFATNTLWKIFFKLLMNFA